MTCISNEPMRLRIAHVSMQFSDKRDQQLHDARVAFSRGYDIITGTEAGGDNGVAKALEVAAEENGYRLHNPRRYDTWVAVKGEIVADKWNTGQRFALWRSSRTTPKPRGRWGDKGIAWATFDFGGRFGRVAVGSVHYLTRGGAGDYKRPSDRKYAEQIRKWVTRKGKKSRLAFIGGDFNLVDKHHDLFYGVPMTTCWDDLQKWPGTGHGNIDAIARYDKDTRVRCVGARALRDNRVFLHSDHFIVEAEYEIKPR